jgi:hypothetical protein
MKEEVKNFVELYNRNMSWNKDILNSMNIDYINKYEYTKDFVKDKLTTETITADDYDLEHAEVYSYDDGLLELQVYSYESYHGVYFWANPNEDEDAYKNKKITWIVENLDKSINEKKEELNKLSSILENEIELRNMLK